jgi:hypothetical protein
MTNEKWENDYGWIRQKWLDDYSPRAWKRGATAFSFDPRNPNEWNMLFWHGGKGVDELGNPKRGQLTKFGSRVQKQLHKAAGFDDATKLYDQANPNKWIRKSGILTESGELAHWWDPRMMSRISAAGDFAKKAVLSEKNVTGLTSYLKAGANENLAKGIESFVKDGGEISGADAATMTRLGVSGAFSGRLMGGLEGLRFGLPETSLKIAQATGFKASTYDLNESVNVGLKWGDQVRNWAIDENGQNLAYRDILHGKAISSAGADAARAAGEDVAKTAGTDIAKKLGARLALAGAEAAGALGEGGLNPVMDILAIASIAQLGFDVAKIGADVVGGGVKAASASYRGDITRTPGSGFGFHDTVASATARQRGLQAIASSRLNARSILGNEAGPMYSHFAGSEMGY